MKPLTPESGPAYLFCPASRPDRYQKALDAADFVILDLEDAVAPADKATARKSLLDNPVDPDAVIVRVNPLGSPHVAADFEALSQTRYRRVMVSKADDPEALGALPGFEVVALCETARGVLRAEQIAAVPSVIALMWGAEDLLASLGGRASRDQEGQYVDVARYARSSVLLAAGANAKAAIDAVVLGLEDERTLRDESRYAAASGFSGKACIHPRQVPVVREAFVPSADQVAWARRVIDATSDGGVSVVDGVMVDEPLLRQAHELLRAIPD